ncbi:protein that induces appearance of [PIN+] prion when overproduced [Rhizina undulata]
MSQQQAYANRAIRSIRNEIDFLLDLGTLPPQAHSQILSLLPPVQSSASVPTPVSVGPVPKSTTPAVPHSTASPPPSHRTPFNESSIQAAIAPPPQRVQPQPVPLPPPQPPTYTPTPLVLSRAEALWAFPGTELGDLSFQAGQTIEVLEKVKEDWWKGRVVGRSEIGLFPSSYVREIQKMAEKPALPMLPPRNNVYPVQQGYGQGGNMLTDVAHGGQGYAPAPQMQAQDNGGEKEKSSLQKNGGKIGKKLGNAAIFGAGATIGSNMVNAIF